MLKVIFLAPFLEELAFRLFLKPDKKYYIFISFFIICFYIKSFLDFNFYFLFILCTFLLIFLFFYAQKITRAINNYFVLFFYGSASFFALLHLKGFNSLNEIQSVLFPILLLPYFFYAVSFSYVRMKAGIIFSILLHMFINGLAFSIKYLALHFTELIG